MSDLADVDPNVRNAVNYTAVSHMDQVLAMALLPFDGQKEGLFAEPSVPTENRDHRGAVIRQ